MGAGGLLEHMQPCPKRLLTSRAGALGHLGASLVTYHVTTDLRKASRPHAERGGCESTRNGRGISITLQQQTPS